MYYEDCKIGDKSKRNYTVIAGDTFPASITIKQNGEILHPSLVTSLKFKLADENFEKKYSQDFEYNEVDEKWFLNLPSSVTATLGDGTYIYEYELTLLDGYVTTIMQAKFKIKKEIRGE